MTNDAHEAHDAPIAGSILEWDSAHFGLRVGRIAGETFSPRHAGAFRRWCDEEHLDCVYLLVPPERRAARSAARELGFRRVDTRVTLVLDFASTARDRRCEPQGIRRATAEDEEALRNLARSAHRETRFRRDGRFDPARCDDLYAEWISSSLRNEATRVFLAVDENASVIGYVTCEAGASAAEGAIGLLAVTASSRRRGVGTGLLECALVHATAIGLARLVVVTQGDNAPALRLYERLGFRETLVEEWYHWWRDR